MSRHVQRQSWKLVGSAQHGSEHPNRQLLASSFLALCLIFFLVFFFFLSASLSSDVFLSRCAYSFIQTREHTKPAECHKCTISWTVSSIGLYKGPLSMLTKCSHEMFPQQALTFVYGSVHSNSIMSGKPQAQKCVTAASEMRISCSINLLSLSLFLLCFSCLHVLRSIFVAADSLHCDNNYRSDHKTVMSDSVSKHPRGKTRWPCPLCEWCVVCTVSSRETVVCSFLLQSLRRKSCLRLQLSSPLWTIKPPDIKKHWSTKL